MADAIAPGGKTISVVEESCGPFWQVAAWPNTIADVEAHLASICGTGAPGPGESREGESVASTRVGPLVWWVVGGDEALHRRLADLDPERGTVLNLNGNRRVFRVRGLAARSFMQRIAPIDFRERAFPRGRAVSSIAHHISIAIVAVDGGFDLFVTSSFARTLREILEETAAQFA